MLSTLPSLADRAFIIGFLLPTLFFSAASSLIFRNQVDDLFGPGLLNDLLGSRSDQVANLATLAGGLWLVSVFLLILNRGIYRFLQGYLPPLVWCKRGRLRAARTLRRLRSEAMRLCVRIGDGPVPAREARRYKELMKALGRLPPDVRALKPTRFGNAVGAFELYPKHVYGADGVALWLHVAPLAPKELIDTVAETRSRVDFMVNCGVFATLIVVLLGARIACSASLHGIGAAVTANDWQRLWIAGRGHDMTLLLAVLVAAAIFHELALAQIPAWGDAVKACFDVGLPELATKLGFKLPDTQAGRYGFWDAFSQAVTYGTYPDLKHTSIFRVQDWLPRPPPPSLLHRTIDGLRCTRS